MVKTKLIAEFGDFQTPEKLASNVCRLLVRDALRPASVIEPTCGVGNLLFAALQVFPSIQRAIAFDINAAYVDQAQGRLRKSSCHARVQIEQGDFFLLDWHKIVDALPQPVLVIGNPPWVTNAALRTLGSKNLPDKSNFHGYQGIDAITGKSNFDISEWMLIRILEWLNTTEAVVALLCKTSVARKALHYAWKNGWKISNARLYKIDAARYFGAAVEASLLVVSTARNGETCSADVYDSFLSETPSATLAFRDDMVIANLAVYERWKHLQANAPVKWRSGVKHDCSKVMELRKESGGYRNNMGEFVELEDTYLFPMLKSSDVANGGAAKTIRWMLVPQQFVGEDTSAIERLAPKTWAYLNNHEPLFRRRGSSIYKGQCSFSIFGIGEYSFAPWKVAISGFYKRLCFTIVPPVNDRPVMLDDTCYFLPCQSEQEAKTLTSMLNSEAAADFFSAFIFWDAKRPITVDLLRRLSIASLAKELRIDTAFLGVWATETDARMPSGKARETSADRQQLLW